MFSRLFASARKKPQAPRFKPTTELLEDRTLLSATLLRDINTSTGSGLAPSFPGAAGSTIARVGNTVYFAADDGVHGYELWKTDGTDAGTVLVKDIRTTPAASFGPIPSSPGTLIGSNPTGLTAVGDTLYFVADDGVHGPEVWKSDGTEAGTVLVKDVNPNNAVFTGAPGAPINLTAVGNSLFFEADDGVHGWEWWKSDGTDAGTHLIKDIDPNPNGPPASIGDPGLLRPAVVGGVLYFVADDGVHGPELWRTAGTAAGTRLVKDINPGTQTVLGGAVLGSPGSGPSWLTNVNGTLYFAADDGTHGSELWKSDGTEKGTVIVADLNTTPSPFGLPAGSGPAYLTAVNGTLYFTANDGVHGTQVWKSDGTAAGTTRVTDLTAGFGMPGSGATLLTAAGNTLYFVAGDGTHGTQLYKTDGTAAGTVSLKDDLLGNGQPLAPGLWSGLSLANVGGTLFFTAGNFGGPELWKTDGTPGHTTKLATFESPNGPTGPMNLTAVGNTVYFAASDRDHGLELWKSDGTAAGTRMVRDVNHTTQSSVGGAAVAVGGTVFFPAFDPDHGEELWKTDGTAAGTVLVKDINATGPGASSFPSWLTAFHGQVFFAANDGVHGLELWKSDGTAAGTVMVKDIDPGNGPLPPGVPPTVPPPFGTISDLTVVGDTLYFVDGDAVHGTALWKTDGTEAGTVMVKDPAPTDSSVPIYGTYTGAGAISNLTDVNGTLYFTGDDGVHGAELWKSDGTEAGTVLVKDLFPGTAPAPAPTPIPIPGPFPPAGPAANSGLPLALRNVNGTLFFTADDGVHGRELWKSDGTEAGTVLVKDINPGPAGSSQYFGGPFPAEAVDYGGSYFFTATDGTGSTDLWKSDGTDAGTVRVKHFGPPGLSPFGAQHLTVANGTLYFTADDGMHGQELWKSDGTEAGTVLVKDINPGQSPAPFPGAPTVPNSSNPSGLTDVNGTLYFVADDGVHGAELWKSDGTEAGTVLAADVNPGPAAGFSVPQAATLLAAGGAVYFAADDGQHGQEMWKETPAADGNRPPTASAGGPYAIRAGDSLTLDAGASADPDGDPLSYSWDVNGDGTYNDAVGARPTLSTAQLQALGIRVGSSYAVHVRVSDGHGHEVVSPTAALRVDEAPPERIPDPTLTVTLTPDQRFVSHLYHDLLHRDVDPSGLAHWGGLLDGGTSRGDVVRGIEASSEYRTGVVRELYGAYLHRDVDSSGLNTFTTFLGAGGTVEQVIGLLVSSPEYYQQHGGGSDGGFLAQVYRDVLGREIDAGGAGVFGRALAAGASRQQVLAVIVGSPEYQQHTVRGFYQTYLGRGADDTGLNLFASALARGTRREEIIAAVAGSEEYFGRDG
jgi:ELWxxDGT repeat protein